MYRVSRRTLLQALLAQPFAAAAAGGQVLHQAPPLA